MFNDKNFINIIKENYIDDEKKINLDIGNFNNICDNIDNIINKKCFISPVNINELDINVNILSEKIKDYFTPSRIQFIKDTSTNNLVLDSNYMEWALKQSIINSEWIGQGNAPMDIIVNNIGIDVLCCCINKNETNEKSLIQNFSSCGSELDILFKNGKKEIILNSFINNFKNKMNKFIDERKCDQLYYMAFISDTTSIYMYLLKINLHNLCNIICSDFTNNNISLNISNIINNSYGHTKIYKSKKRIEIRFKKSILKSKFIVKIY